MTTRNDGLKLLELPKQLDPLKTIEMLEGLLERARNNEIAEFMIVCWRADGNFFTQGSGSQSVLRRVGSLETLKFDLLKNSNE